MLLVDFCKPFMFASYSDCTAAFLADHVVQKLEAVGAPTLASQIYDECKAVFKLCSFLVVGFCGMFNLINYHSNRC